MRDAVRPRSGCLPLSRFDWYARGHAALLERVCPRHERLVTGRKRVLLGGLEGEVAEVGPGTGANLAYFGPAVRWTGIEPNPYLAERARARAAELRRVAEVRSGAAGALPFPDGSLDAVVATLVLCTVPDVGQALREIRRVLRPGGRFVFLEHVAAPPGTWTRRWQRLVRPAWSVVGDGCRPDRDTAAALERAGFARVEIERFRLPLPIVGPHIAGTLVR